MISLNETDVTLSQTEIGWSGQLGLIVLELVE